jgi:hypothetical protein
MQHVESVCRAISLTALMTIAGCHARRPNFMTRVRQDCASGQQWACDLLDALSRPSSSDDPTMPDSFRGHSPTPPPRPSSQARPRRWCLIGFAHGNVWHNNGRMGGDPGWSHFMHCRSRGSHRVLRLKADGPVIFVHGVESRITLRGLCDGRAFRHIRPLPCDRTAEDNDERRNDA